MLEAVIFDMDGVIVDTEPVYFRATKEFLGQFGHVLDKKYNEKFFGVSSYDAWTKMKEDFGIEEISVEECIQGMEKIRDQIIEEEGFQAIPGTIPLIKELHAAGIPLAVASSSSLKDIQSVIDFFEIGSCFLRIVSGSDECENSKPFPDVFLKASEKLHTAPEKCLVIEDSDNGALAAKRAGMKVIGFKNQQFGNQSLKDADLIVTSMKDINLELCRKIGEVK